MDIDAMEKRLAAIEGFLNTVEPEWRTAAAMRAAAEAESKQEPMVVDAEQTKADRIALGYDVDPNADDENGTKQDALDGDGGPKANAWTDPAGHVWTSSDGKLWVTGEDMDRQSFEGSLEELQIVIETPPG